MEHKTPRFAAVSTGLLASFFLVSALFLSSGAQAFDTKAQQAILIDLQTGAVLFEKNADDRVPPSSMSKLMTVYMVFERLKSGSLSLDDTFLVSKKAWRKGGSKMFVEVGKRVRVEDLLRGIIIQSGNDACIVVSENLAADESSFAEAMTQRGLDMGLTSSTFVNATGWPDEGHLMSVRDLSILAQRLIEDFPEYYPFYSETSFTFSNIPQQNRNPLLYINGLGADGLKTGHTEAGGYGLVGTAVQDGRRLIMVANGMDSAKTRAIESERLLNWGFREFTNVSFFDAGEIVEEAEVWLGQKGAVPLVLNQSIFLTLPRSVKSKLKVSVRYTGPIPAPVERGTHVADLIITAKGMQEVSFPLLAGESVAKEGVVGRISAALRHILWGFAS